MHKKSMKNLCYLTLTGVIASFITCFPGQCQSGVFVRPDSSSLPTPVAGQTWLFNSTNGQIYVYNGSTFSQISPPQSNYSAVTVPGVNNDNTQGYEVGSVWYNVDTGAFYICTNPATGAANWAFITSSTISPALISQLLYTNLSTGDFVSSAVLPAVPGSGLTTTLNGGLGYVNGNAVVISTQSKTFSNNSWTYVFINADGTYNFQVQSPSTTPPTIANTVLAYLVETSGGNITSVVPYYALPATLRNYQVAVPNTSGLVLQTNTSVSGTGLQYALVPVSSLSASGSTAGQTLVSNGSSWSANTLALSGLSSSGSTANQVLGINNAATAYEFKTPASGTDVAVTNTTGVQTFDLTGQNGATPTITAGAGGDATATVSVVGSNVSGTITVVAAGTPSTNATIATLTFNGYTFSSAPHISLTPTNANAGAQTGIWAAASTTALVIHSGASALSASTTYTWDYHVLQ